MKVLQRETLLLLSILPLLHLTPLAQISNGEVPAFPSMPNLGKDPLQPHRFLTDAEGEGEPRTPDYETEYSGGWEIANVNAGVSSMHMQLMPLTGKVVMFDATYYGKSGLQLPANNCRLDFDKMIKDCWAHCVEFDIATSKVRPLKVLTDTWCSSGSLAPNGTLVHSGGWQAGAKAARYLTSCDNCDWIEYKTSLSGPRWYATQLTLQDGSYIVIGGRKMFSYEYIPKPGQSNPTNFKLPFLKETSDRVENNLYPFVHLSTDGNLFIFANNRSILFNPTTQAVVREFPVLADGPRNYPGSGMSVLLPIKVRGGSGTIPAEVLVCGGSPPDATDLAGTGEYIPALHSCGRIVITKPNTEWQMEDMPGPRVMSDMLILPNGDVLQINGAKKGVSGWGFAKEPVFEPYLYKPKMPSGKRFRVLARTNIPRMYHSTSAVIPDGRVMVAGSNTNRDYTTTSEFPTELRVEMFRPPYMDPTLAERRPKIDKDLEPGRKLKYGEWFKYRVISGGDEMRVTDVITTMYAPPFTTHGWSMNQRLLVLKGGDLTNVGPKKYEVNVMAPPSSVLAPPGYYLLFAVHRGLPSEGTWVQIM